MQNLIWKDYRKAALTALSTTALTSMAFISPTAAVAQSDDDDFNMEVLMVTARKVAEPLQEIPVAITAFSAEDMRRKSISDLEDVALLTPGLVFEDFSNGGFGAPTIRGATQFSITSLEQNVSVLLDGIYIPRQYAFDLGAMNLERIEVVKGPQSALYGANAFAGAINYVSFNRSLTDWQATAQLDVSENGGFDISGKLNAPIAEDMFAVRLAVAYSRFGGDWTNNHPDAATANVDPGTDETFGGYKKTNIQAGFSMKPIEALTIELDYFNFNSISEPRAQFRLSRNSGDTNCSADILFGFLPVNQLFCGELPGEPIPGPSGTEGLVIDPRSIGMDSETELLRLNMRAEITDNFAAVYQFGYTAGDVFSAGSSDRDPLVPTTFAGVTGNVFTLNPFGNFDYTSHEVRFEYVSDSGFSAMIGGFLQRGDDFETTGGGIAPFRGLDPITSFADVVVTNAVEALTETNVNAIFGRAVLPLLDDRLTIELEGRYTDEEKILTQSGVLFEPSFEDSYFTPRGSIDYKLTDNNLVYASIARGVKSGGINASNADLEPEEVFYGPDSNWTYEIGIKNTFLNGRATLNVAAFYIDWSDLQLSVLPVNGNQNDAAITQNIGAATSKGIEIESVFEVVEGITLNGGLAYIDASYKEGIEPSQRIVRANLCNGGVVCNEDGDIGGNDLQRTSDWQWNVGIAADGALTDSIDYFGRVDVAGQSSQFVSEINVAIIPARTLVNANIGISGERWTASIYAKNLLNESYVSNSFFIALPFFVDYVPTLGAQRRIGARLTFDY